MYNWHSGHSEEILFTKKGGEPWTPATELCSGNLSHKEKFKADTIYRKCSRLSFVQLLELNRSYLYCIWDAADFKKVHNTFDSGAAAREVVEITKFSCFRIIKGQCHERTCSYVAWNPRLWFVSVFNQWNP